LNYFFYCTARFFSILQLFCALHVFARKSVGMNKILADSFTLFAKKQQAGLAKQPLLHTRTSNFPTALLHVVARGKLDAYTPCMEQSGKIFNSWAHMLEWYSHLCKCDLVCKIANTNWRLSPLHLEISARLFRARRLRCTSLSGRPIGVLVRLSEKLHSDSCRGRPE